VHAGKLHSYGTLAGVRHPSLSTRDSNKVIVFVGFAMRVPCLLGSSMFLHWVDCMIAPWEQVNAMRSCMLWRMHPVAHTP
jgi:hypothetical protein